MRWHRWIAGTGVAALTLLAGPSHAAGAAPCGASVTTPVPQPTAAHLAAAGLSRFPFAPDDRRVDLVAPPLELMYEVGNEDAELRRRRGRVHLGDEEYPHR